MTAKGQVSVPAAVREKLGIGPGSVLEWDEQDGTVVVRRVGKYTFADIHKAIFGNHPPEKRTLEELKEAIPNYIRKRHARR